MTRVELRRLDARFPPLRELLFVEGDGTFRMWRSNAEVVGRFAGRVPDPAGFAALIDDAVAQPAPPGADLTLPDAVEDELRVGDRRLATTPSDGSRGPWGMLLAECRDLLNALLDQPLAAVALEIPDPTLLRLVHVGGEPLSIELGSLSARAEVYRDTTKLDAVAPDLPDIHHVDVGPGWSLEIALPPLTVPLEALLLVRAQFVADDEGVYVPVELSRSWQPQRD
jgi:hypothetical protein